MTVSDGSDLPSGRLRMGLSMRKCPGVIAWRSLGSVEMTVSGLEFRLPSISVRSVLNSSNVRICFPTTRRRWCFIYFTAAPDRPPKCSARGGMVTQSIPSCDMKFEIDSSV